MDRYGRGKRFRLSFSGQELALLVGGISVICLLFYLFGLNVGRNQAGRVVERVALKQESKGPEEPAPEKRTEESGVEEASAVRESSPGEKEAKTVGLTFYDTLPNKEKGTSSGTGAAVPEKITKKVVPKSEKETATKTAVTEQPPTHKKTTPQGGKVYSVQVGSFKDWAKAMALKRRLLEAGYRAYTAQVGSSAKGTWFKVRVGDFKEKSEAEKTARRLGVKEKLPAFAVAVEREARR